MLSKKNLHVLAIFIMILSLICPQSLWAVGSSGFENASYSAKTLGQANAVVARPQDGSTILFNPAGIVELPGIQTSLGLQGLDWRIFHRNNVTGNHAKNRFKIIPLPSFWLTVNPGEMFDNRFAFGVGVNSPFGLENHWRAENPFAEVGYSNRLKLMATTIAGSFRLTDWLDVGAGAINYYVFDYGFKFDYPNSFILGGAAANDGLGLTETQGFGWGWNFGLLLKPREDHKIGFSYRSRANVDVSGRARIEDIVLGATQGFPTFPHFETAVYSDIPLPQNVTVAYAYEPSDKWAAEVDLGWTDWSDFADQDHGFDQPNAVLRALGTIPRNYDDTISVHLGGHYQVNQKWDSYGGFAFYSAASPKKHVDNFLPDANRYLWTAGTTYSFSERFDVDFSYMFMLLATRHISNPQQLTRTGQNIDGRYTSIIHGAFVTFTYRFDFPGEKNKSAATVVETQPPAPLVG